MNRTTTVRLLAGGAAVAMAAVPAAAAQANTHAQAASAARPGKPVVKGLSAPFEISFANKHKLFVADGSGVVDRANVATGHHSAVFKHLPAPDGVAFVNSKTVYIVDGEAGGSKTTQFLYKGNPKTGHR